VPPSSPGLQARTAFGVPQVKKRVTPSPVTGTIYAASAHLLMNGNGCTSTLNALIVIADLTMKGNPARLHSTYTLEHNVAIPLGDLRLDQ
jgi:hypothetical protein